MFVQRLLAFVILTTATIYAQFDSSGCGSSKGCLFDPPGCDPFNTCNKALSWRVNSDFLEFQMVGLASPSGGPNDYLAVGFSNDQTMGDEPVTYCTFGTPFAGFAYNSIYKSNARVTDYLFMSNDVAITASPTIYNGHLYCSFRQRINPSQSNSRVLTLNRNAYIFIAFGTLSGQDLNMHDTTPGSNRFPYVSPKTLNLADTSYYAIAGSFNSSASVCSNYPLSPTTSLNLIKAHGAMMILGWFIFIATGIMFARYFRGHWPNTKPMGLLMWFHFHRTLNIIGVLLITASFICVFTANCWRWEGPTGSVVPPEEYWGAVHCMTGLLACVLAWEQPIGSLLRCAPGKPLRPIFNWLHRIAGLAGWALAATAIVVAVKEFPKLWSDSKVALRLVIAYLVFLGAILILQELITIFNMITGRSTVHVDAVETQPAPKGPDDPSEPPPVAISTTVVTNSKSKVVRLVLMGLFIVIGSGLAIALVVLLALADPNLII